MTSTTNFIDIGQNKEFRVFKSKLIGEGAQGQVYDSSFQPEKPFLPICTKITNFGRQQVLKEQEILQKLQQHSLNPNIVKIYYVHHNNFDNNLYTVMEKCSTSLQNQINIKKIFTFKEIENFVYQFVNGYQPLDQNKIVHLDIKPENILLHNNQYKITDFGIGQFYENNQFIVQRLGTPIYTAPEINIVHKDSSLDQIIKSLPDKSVCDMYSLGMILYQMAFGDFPFQTNEKGIQSFLQEIKIRPFKINKEYIYSIFLTTIEKMLIYNPQNRLTFNQLLSLVQKSKQSQSRISTVNHQPSEFQNYLQEQLRKYFQEAKEFLSQTLHFFHNQFKPDVQKKYENIIRQGFWNQDCDCIFELFTYDPSVDQYNQKQLSFFVSLQCIKNKQVYPYDRNIENMKRFLDRQR